MSQLLISAWTDLAAGLNARLFRAKKTTWTHEEYEKVARLLIAYAVSGPGAWVTKGTTENGSARLPLEKTEWQPAYTSADWAAVARIIRAEMPSSMGFSLLEHADEPIIIFEWIPPTSTARSGLSQ